MNQQAAASPGGLGPWLDGLGLGRYAQGLAEADIDLAVLPHLSDADLRELGIGSLGHRRKLMAAARALAGSGPSAPAARRFITVMFCDIVGSTQLAETMGAEAFSGFLKRYHAWAWGVVEGLGGHVAQLLGDGVLVYFGAPKPLEDAAARAVTAALRLTGGADRLTRRGAAPLRLRVGVASGMVVFDDAPGAAMLAVGGPVHLAARLQAAGAPGQVVLSAATASLVQPGFALAGLGTRTLKDIAEPQRLYTVTAEQPGPPALRLADPAPTTRFVNRGAEMAALHRVLARAREGGLGVALISGEPGIGKSRLTVEFLRQARDEGATVQAIACSPLATAIPFFPLLNNLGKLGKAGDTEAAALAQRLAAAGTVAPQDRRAWRDETIARLAGYLGAPPQAATEVIWVEDLHWIDPSTAEVLDRLLRLPELRRCVLLTSRAGAAAAPLALPDGSLRLELAPLSLAHTEEIVRDRLPRPAAAELIASLAQRADGVPIFAEELANEVGARGETGLGGDLALPISLQQSLQARIERLGPGGAQLLRLAASMGRVSPMEILQALWEPGQPFPAALADLTGSGLATLRAGDGDDGSAHLEIRHQVVRECAYDMILMRDRRAIHASVADLLTGPMAGRCEQGIVAEQLERAARFRQAATAWANAGRAAARQSADREATVLFQRALAVASKVREKTWRNAFEADTLARLHPAMIGSGSYRSFAPELHARLAQLVAATGTPHRRMGLVFVDWLELVTRGAADEAHQLALDAASLAEADESGVLRMVRDRMLGSTHMFRGEFAASRACNERFIAAYDAARHAAAMSEFGVTDNYATVLASLAAVTGFGGDRAATDRAIARAVAAAEAGGHVHTLCHSLAYGVGLTLLVTRRYDEAIEVARRVARLADQGGREMWRAYADLVSGIARTGLGDRPGGVRDCNRGWALLTRADAFPFAATFRCLLVRAEHEAGLPLTFAPAEIALQIAGGERWVEPLLVGLTDGAGTPPAPDIPRTVI